MCRGGFRPRRICLDPESSMKVNSKGVSSDVQVGIDEAMPITSFTVSDSGKVFKLAIADWIMFRSVQ